MDANGTRFHLVAGHEDWRRCQFHDADGHPVARIEDASVFWNDDRAELTLRPRVVEFAAPPGDHKPRLGAPQASPPDDICDRRGAAADRFGNWYFLSRDGTGILAYSSGCRVTTRFWPAAAPVRRAGTTPGLFQSDDPPALTAALAFSGLTVTEDHYLVVGTLAPKGLLVFDLHAGGPPTRQIVWPEAVAFAPFDLAPRPGGGLWVLDRVNRCYWGLDRRFALSNDPGLIAIAAGSPDTFQPADGLTTRGKAGLVFPSPMALDHGSPVAASDPIAIEALADGSVLILDAAPMPSQNSPGRRASRLLRYRSAELLGDPVSLAGDDARVERAPTADFGVAAYDMAFRSEPSRKDATRLGRIVFAGEEGNQAFAFILRSVSGQCRLEFVPEYLPMRLFSGMGIVTAPAGIHYDSQSRWVPLASQSRPRFAFASKVVTDASHPFDGREPQCVWHRLFLDACLPPETEVAVLSRAADSPAELERAPWLEEPRPYRRRDGSELPFLPQSDCPSCGTFELLFQQARGRYLQLQLELRGNGRATPRLRALRLYYPRFSYLERYLPEVYRQDRESASFLDRFLANVEGVNTAIEDRVAAAQMLFDLRSAPADGLDWLAGWFGLALDPAWDELRRRLMLSHAMDFFQWRGTAHGLRMALRLALEPAPDEHLFDPPGADCRCGERFRIVERFLTRRTPAAALGDPTEETTPRPLNAGERWMPELGTDELQRRYREARRDPAAVFALPPSGESEEDQARASFATQELGFEPSDPSDEITAWQRYVRDHYASFAEFLTTNGGTWTAFNEVEVPADRPATARLREDWRRYQLSADPEVFGVQRRLWQDFLTRRHVSVLALNAAHGTHWDAFSQVAYPATLPTNRKLLRDWYDFEALVRPTISRAHQFSVLLPLNPATAGDLDARHALLARAHRIVELERPAHTTFDVKFYWALFRIGEARLGHDSLLGLGGRDPALLPVAVLGRAYLADAYVTSRRPFDSAQRAVLGATPLN